VLGAGGRGEAWGGGVGGGGVDGGREGGGAGVVDVVGGRVMSAGSGCALCHAQPRQQYLEQLVYSP
jgi:hypothetical protein